MATTPTIDHDYLIALAQRLVHIDSVNPHHATRPPSEANEEQVTDLLAVELSELGLAHLKEYPAPHRPILMVEVGQDCGPVLLLNAHTDTVGTAGLANPFSGEIRNARLHGRGAADTKASLAAMAAVIRAIVKADLRLKGRCIFCAVCDEEYAGIGTQHFLELGRRVDAAVVGEPTKLELGVGQVGGVKFKIVCRGKAAHGNIPEAGISAILKASGLAQRLSAVAKKRRHPLLGTPGFNIGRISGGVDASTVPERCELDCDRRILPGETVEEIYRDIGDLLIRMRDMDPDFRAELMPPYLGPVYGFELPPQEPLVLAMGRAYQEATGLAPARVVTPYAGDGMYLHGAGIPAVTFGPGDIREAHFGQEAVDLDQLITAAQVLLLTVLDFCGVEE